MMAADREIAGEEHDAIYLVITMRDATLKSLRSCCRDGRLVFNWVFGSVIWLESSNHFVGLLPD
jgi:hypothetical protein